MLLILMFIFYLFDFIGFFCNKLVIPVRLPVMTPRLADGSQIAELW